MLGVWGWFFSLLVCTRLGSCWCAFLGFRPSGVNLLGLYQPDHLEDNLAVHYTALLFGDWVYFSWGIFLGWKLYMLALVGQPSLHGYNACMVFWDKGALRRNCRQTKRKTSFSPCCVFRCSRYSFKKWWGKVLWLLWVGRARHPGPFSGSMSVEVFNVGGWLTHGDLALEADVDFLAVVEHRLVPARVRSEWARLRARGASSVWSPASQESSHVGHGGVGVVSLKGAPLSLPASATSQFRRFYMRVHPRTDNFLCFHTTPSTVSLFPPGVGRVPGHWIVGPPSIYVLSMPEAIFPCAVDCLVAPCLRALITYEKFSKDTMQTLFMSLIAPKKRSTHSIGLCGGKSGSCVVQTTSGRRESSAQ